MQSFNQEMKASCTANVTSLLVAFLLVNTAAAIASLFGSEQSTAVRGKLECDGKPAVGVKVKLYDVDRTDLDDLMAEGVTDEEGAFELAGWEKEVSTIDPKVNM